MDNILRIFKGVDEEGHPKPFPLDANGEPDGENNIISEFTYSAKRMSTAPNITCTFKYPICLDEQWDDTVFVVFNNEKFFINKTPTSSYSNTEALYKHEVTFVSERVVLENVYFFDCVYQYGNDYQVIVNSTSVPFFGTIEELAQRLNYSLQYSGLQIADTTNGNYVSGYRVIVDDRVDDDGYDELYNTGKLVTAQDIFFHDVLQEIYNTYEIPYYFKGKEIHIGFGSAQDIISEAPNTPFQYGIDNSLISITKHNTNDKIVNRITGVGSSENIPYYYPNPTERGEVRPTFLEGGAITDKDIDKCDIGVLLEKTNLVDKVEYKVEGSEKTYGEATMDVSYYATGTIVQDTVHPQPSAEKFSAYIDINSGGVSINPQSSIFNDSTAFRQGYYYTVRYSLVVTLTCKKTGYFDLDFVVPKPILPPNSELKWMPGGARYEVELWDEKKLYRKKFEYITETEPCKGTYNIGNLSMGEVRNYRLSWYIKYKSEKKPNEILAAFLFVNVRNNSYDTRQYYWTGLRYKSKNILDFGITLKDNVTQDLEQNPEKYKGTAFTCEQVYRIHPQTNLMPPIYRESNGEERFYNATNYPFLYEDGYTLRKGEELIEGYVHNKAYLDDEGEYIKFTNPYIEGKPHEHIENFEDIKPSIKGMTNNEGKPLDQFLEIAFDKYDNDEITEDNHFEHPYFFVKLPKFDFNLFEQKIEKSEMVISMTSGKCGACEFVIVVDADSQKNLVQLNDDGTLQRDDNGDVVCGRKKEETAKDEQNDTINNEVWIALEKDEKTYGIAMPNAAYKYHPTTEDKFVILNIDLPESYITAAEERLKDALISCMEEKNNEKFTFSMKFSRIYLAENPDIVASLNENSKVWLKYNNEEPVLNVSSYSYKVKSGEPLPEITVELKDSVSIPKNVITNSINQAKNEILTRLSPANIVAQLTPYHVRKDIDDIVKGKTNFEQGLISWSTLLLGDSIQTNDFMSGINGGRGWAIDNYGNAELESVKIRSFMEVVEMLINKTSAQEGDTLFTDNDQIESVSYYYGDEDVDGDGDKDTLYYILTLKEKYEGYVHTQMYGNILKGTINTLAAKNAGVSDEFWLKNDYSDDDAVERDIAGNTYYTSWMRVVATSTTKPTICGKNQIIVTLYSDYETPAGKNFVPCKLMNIARWGCIDYNTDNDPQIAESIERRQRLFYISNIDGRIVKLRKVDKPKLEYYNYGTTIGILPEFVQEYTSIKDRIDKPKDYLYAKGIVVEDLIKVTSKGDPIVNIVDRGQWKDKEKYFYNEYNTVTAQQETHDVWNYGLRWRCLQSQPVVDQDKNEIYFEPTWGSIGIYWQPIEGDMSLTMEFTSSNGYSFRRSAAWETEIKPHIFFGSMEITNYTQKVKILRWERKHEVETGDSNTLDDNWNANHKEIEELELTQNDMSVYWSSKNKMIFTCIAEVNDGNNTIIVENQITA